jgi:capsular polysaccharide transport system ATP-binding protein
MIEIQDLWKAYRVASKSKLVAKGISLQIPQNTKLAILGKNGAGKSTLLRIIAGIEDPDHGKVISHGSVSWPIGIASSFHPDLTGRQNVRFVARIYGVDQYILSNFVTEFAELGFHFDAPIRTYSSGMKARLGFAVAMGIEFDTYLLDEITAVGDANFKRKSSVMLKEKLEKSSAIIVAHSMGFLREVCNQAIILHDGRVKFYEDIEAAIHDHRKMSNGETVSWIENDR